MRQKGWMKNSQKQDYDDHLRRMREMKSTTDSSAPRKLGKTKRKEMERVSIYTTSHTHPSSAFSSITPVT